MNADIKQTTKESAHVEASGYNGFSVYIYIYIYLLINCMQCF